MSKLTALVAVLAGAALTLGCNAVLGIDSAPDRPDTPQDGECRTHSDCLAQSTEFAPDVCVSGSCVPLFTDSCPFALPQTGKGWLQALRTSGPQALILGAFNPLYPVPFDLVGHDYDLALTELANTTGGLPAAGGGTRPVVVVACHNQYASQEDFDAAADHLIKDLQVPAILPAIETEDVQHLFEHSAHDAHVLLLSPIAVEKSLIDYADDGLIWAILPSADEVAAAYPPLLSRILAHLVATGALDENERPRVALIRADDVREEKDLASAVEDQLGIDGPDTDASSPDFRVYPITSTTGGDPSPDYSKVVTELADFQPHVVIGVAYDELPTRIIPALEASTRLEPFYLVSPYQYLRPATDTLLRDIPELQQRMAGVNYSAAEDQSVNVAYQARFDTAYPNDYAGITGHENLYDAIYYLLYAAAAGGKAAPVFGPDLADGMRDLLTGRKTFAVGPDDLPAAFAALAAPGSSITLDGAMGPPGFDPNTSARHMPGSVWCVDADDHYRADVLRLEGTELVGSFPCFEFGDP